MPSSTSNPEFQAPKSTSSTSSADGTEQFFGHDYEGHLEDLSLQEYYTKFKDNLASLILDEREEGTAEDDIKTKVKKYSFQQIVQLPKSMKEEQNLPEEQQEIAIFYHMDQIATEIMESGWLQSRWLQNLKNIFEAFLLEKLEQGRPPNDIEELAQNFIDQRIDEKGKTMLEEGNTAEAIAEVTENASQELEQFLAIELMNNEWFQRLKDQCKPLILEWLQQETALPVIKKQLRNHVALQIEKMRDFLTEKRRTIQEKAKFTEKAFQGMEQFINEITEDGWLQHLKNECEAYLLEELSQGISPNDIKAFANVFIAQEIDKRYWTMVNDGNTAEEMTEVTEKASKELKQFVNEITEDVWLQNLKNECEAFIAKQLDEGIAADDIANQIQQNMEEIVNQHHEFLKKRGIPAEEIEEEIALFRSDLTATVTPLLSELQESQQAATTNDLRGMKSPIIRSKGSLAAAKASTPSPPKGRSIRP